MATDEASMSPSIGRQTPSEDGSYVLRLLVKDVPLASEGSSTMPQISCVELWGQWYSILQFSVDY